MSFHNQLFPEHLSYGTKGGGSFSTAIHGSDSGSERRSAEWESTSHRMQYDVAKSVQTEDDLGELMTFFMCMRGAACGFRFKDPNDWSTATDGTSYPTTIDDAWTVAEWQPGTSSKTFTFRKKYVNLLAMGADAFWRNITRPIPPTDTDHRVLIYWNGELVWRSTGDGGETMAQGVVASIDYDRGRVIFNSVPSGEVKVACTFHVPSRFGQEVDDGLEITWQAAGQFSIDTLPIIEITGDPPSGEEEWLEGGHAIVAEPASFQVISQPLPLQNYFTEFDVLASQAGWFIAYDLAQLNPSATLGAVPQTPLLSGEYFTGGPFCLLYMAETPPASLATVSQAVSPYMVSAAAGALINYATTFQAAGFTIGMEVVVSGFGTAANNGTKTIAAFFAQGATGEAMGFTSNAGMTVEIGDGDEVVTEVGSSNAVYVGELLANGNSQLAFTLAGGQYVEPYWFGNTMGYKAR